MHESNDRLFERIDEIRLELDTITQDVAANDLRLDALRLELAGIWKQVEEEADVEA